MRHAPGGHTGKQHALYRVCLKGTSSPACLILPQREPVNKPSVCITLEVKPGYVPLEPIGKILFLVQLETGRAEQRNKGC